MAAAGRHGQSGPEEENSKRRDPEMGTYREVRVAGAQRDKGC